MSGNESRVASVMQHSHSQVSLTCGASLDERCGVWVVSETM
jgi:hypothetical protein